MNNVARLSIHRALYNLLDCGFTEHFCTTDLTVGSRSPGEVVSVLLVMESLPRVLLLVLLSLLSFARSVSSIFVGHCPRVTLLIVIFVFPGMV
jgi:hypothetical protein